jgi:predicted AAA+ superfamily ATPase
MYLKTELYTIINNQNTRFKNTNPGIMRQPDKNIDDRFNKLIIVNGLKQTGKTNFLYQLYTQYFDDVFYINFGHPGFYGFGNSDLYKLDEIINEQNSKTLFFEEIGILPAWEAYVLDKMEDGYRVVVTLSDGNALNNDYGIRLTGKHTSIELQPFNYSEYCSFHKLPKGKSTLQRYIKTGGFPANCNPNNEEFLSTLFDDIVVREIALRNGVRDLQAFKRLSIHLLQHVSALITGNRLKNDLGIKTTATVVDYLSYLERGHLFYYLPRFSYSVRKQQVNPRKVYVVDPGLVAANTCNVQEKTEALLENLVYLKLRQSYPELYYYAEDYGCDFVAFNKEKADMVIQVCAELQPDNLDVEVKGLYSAMEFFGLKKGVLITMDQQDRFIKDDMEIQVIPFYRF